MHIRTDSSPRISVVIGSNRPQRICPEIGLGPDAHGRRHFFDIDAAFADHLSEMTALAIELDHLVNAARAKPNKPTKIEPDSQGDLMIVVTTPTGNVGSQVLARTSKRRDPAAAGHRP